MKELKDITVRDLLDEGRRWVTVPGEQTDGGVRLDVVFEDHPYRFPMGQISNDPSVLPPVVIEVDDPHAWCVQLCVEHGSIKNQFEYFRIIFSSINAQHRAMDVRVLSGPSGEITLQDGRGNQMVLDEENAFRLYQRIADAYGLPHQIYCNKCGEPLMDQESCLCVSDNSDD